MLKKTNKIILVLTLILSLIFGQGSVVRATSQTDMNLIKSRLKEYFLALDTIDDSSASLGLSDSPFRMYLRI